MSYFFDFGIDKPRKKEGIFTAKGIKQFSSLDDRGIFCSEVQANDAASLSFVSTHHHTDIELIYSLDASIELSVNNERYMMTAGDLIVISPGDPAVPAPRSILTAALPTAAAARTASPAAIATALWRSGTTFSPSLTMTATAIILS